MKIKTELEQSFMLSDLTALIDKVCEFATCPFYDLALLGIQHYPIIFHKIQENQFGIAKNLLPKGCIVPQEG